MLARLLYHVFFSIFYSFLPGALKQVFDYPLRACPVLLEAATDASFSDLRL
jgi:hypothetical protein